MADDTVKISFLPQISKEIAKKTGKAEIDIENDIENIYDTILKQDGKVSVSELNDYINLKYDTCFDDEIFNLDENLQFEVSADDSLKDSDMSFEELNYIMQSIKTKLEQQESEIKADANNKGLLGGLLNGAKGIFGFGLNAKLSKIDKLKETYEELSKNPTSDKIQDLYSLVFEENVDLNSVQSGIETMELISKDEFKLQNSQTISKDDIIENLTSQVQKLDDDFEYQKSSQGIFSKAAASFNNFLGIGTTQNMTDAQLEAYKNLASKLKEADDVEFASIYKEITGEDLTSESLNDLFINQAVKTNSSKAQESMIDCENSTGTVLTSAIAISSAVLTGGASLALSAAAGAGLNVAVRSANHLTQQNNQTLEEKLKDYCANELLKDTALGALNGFANRLGNKVGDSVISKFAIQDNGKYVYGAGVRIASEFLDGATDGAISNAGEYVVKKKSNGEDVDILELIEKTTQGSIAGGVMSVGMQETIGVVKNKGFETRTKKAVPKEILNENAGKMSQYCDKLQSEKLAKELKTNEVDNAIGLMKKGIDGYYVEKLARLDADTCDSALEFVNKGIPASKAADLVCTDGASDVADSLLKNHPEISKYYVSDLALLDEEARKTAIDLIENKGFSAPSAIDAAGKKGAKQEEFIQEILSGKEKMKVEITPQSEEELLSLAKKLSVEYDTNIKNAASITNDIFNPKQYNAKLTSRAKSGNSLLKKLETKYEKADISLDDTTKTIDIDKARKEIGDAYGSRIQMKSLKFSNNEISKIISKHFDDDMTPQKFRAELNECVNNGKSVSSLGSQYKEALDEIKEMQNAQTFEKLLKAVENDKIKITEINNYGDEISCYLTDRQILQLADACYNKYKAPIKIVTKNNIKGEISDDVTNAIDDYGNIRQETREFYKSLYAGESDKEIAEIIKQRLEGFDPKKCSDAVKKSGYTSFQMNVKYNNLNTGVEGYGEIQIRGTEVNSFGDVEHVPYDIRQGKITAADTKYSQVYDAIKNMSDDSYKAYNKYLTEVYEYLRLKEMGIKANKPKLPTNLQYKDGTQVPNTVLDTISKEGLNRFH